MKIDFKGQTLDSTQPIILGKDLKFMRVSNKMTTAEAARSIGLKSRKTIENWEMENSQPSIVTFLAMCALYKFNPALVIAACLERAVSETINNEIPAINLETCRL